MIMKHRRVLAFLIMLIFLLTPAVSPEGTYAVTKVKETISFTNISSGRVLLPGETFQTKYQIKGGKNSDQPVLFMSSDPAVAQIDAFGRITAVSKGPVSITVCLAKKKKVRSTIKIFVGERVKTITLDGKVHLRPGRSSQLTKEVLPKEAPNKSLSWSSGNKKVATVSSSGRVKAKKNGTAQITARAKDGSKTKGSISITVFTLKRSEARWVAHRGECVKRTENTAAAFRQAGKDGFWGCECDIWETKPGPVVDEQGNETIDFDIVINHDPTFSRVWDLDRTVKEMTAQEIRETPELTRVCFLREFLDICLTYDMVPSVELKDEEMSQEAIVKTVDQIYEAGRDAYIRKAWKAAGYDPETAGEDEPAPQIDEAAADAAGKAFLKKTMFISFLPDLVIRARQTAEKNYRVTPETSLNIGLDAYTGDMSELKYAKEHGFTGVSLNKTLLSDEYCDYCHRNGMVIHAWTYRDNLANDEQLYQQVKKKQYGIYSFTTNGRLFK